MNGDRPLWGKGSAVEEAAENRKVSQIPSRTAAGDSQLSKSAVEPFSEPHPSIPIDEKSPALPPDDDVACAISRLNSDVAFLKEQLMQVASERDSLRQAIRKEISAAIHHSLVQALVKRTRACVQQTQAARSQQKSMAEWPNAVETVGLIADLATQGLLDVNEASFWGTRLAGVGSELDDAPRIEPPSVEDQELDFGQAVEALLRAHAWAEDVSRPCVPTGEPAQGPELKDVLDFVDVVIPKLDPTGRKTLTREHSILWDRVIQFASAQGVEVIYPEAGSPFAGAVHEMAAVDMESSLPRNAIVKVVLLGTRFEGQCRKAKVVVRG